MKKEKLSSEQIRIKELTEEVRYCEKLLKRAQITFEMATDDNLIEARIYEMKSLTKQHDYLINTLRSLMYAEDENIQTVNT